MIIFSSNFESFFTNFSFASLFLLVLSYWTQASFFSRNRYKWITSSLTWLSLMSLTSLLITRWFNSGHFPISNLYESLLFLSWGFVIGHIVLELLSKNDLLGAVTSPMALFTNGFAAFSLPKDMQQITPLVPALQSNWLMMHVSVMILSYVALFFGSLLSIAFLLVTSNNTRNDKTFRNKSKAILKLDIFHVAERNQRYQHQKGAEVAVYRSEISDVYTQYPKKRTSEMEISYNQRLYPIVDKDNDDKREGGGFQEFSPLASTLDNLSYRVLGLGFPLLTVGILSGAVWANEAWGSYWSWDPKESWALITWLVFAIYLHMRLTRGWVGKKPAIIATLGFLAVWFCYLGVNLLGVGLHSYGWFQRNVLIPLRFSKLLKHPKCLPHLCHHRR